MTRISRKTNRVARKSIKNITGSIIIITVLLLIGAAYYKYRKAQSSHVKIDKVTLCPKNGPEEITTILIDKTDDLNTVQQSALSNYLMEIRDSIKTHGLLEIYLVGPTSTNLLNPEFMMCNPGRGAELSPLVANPRLAERRWEGSFEKPLRKSFENMLKTEQKATSPVMESIQSIAVSSYLNPNNKKIQKRLVIVSDMLQNTAGLSQYKDVVDFGTFQNSDYYKRVRANLEGVRVEIFYIRRETGQGVQGMRHIEFWQYYFADQGAVVARVISLPG